MVKAFDIYKGENDPDTLDINDYVVQHPASTFFVRMDGPGPDGSDVQSGDVLVVDRAVNPEAGALTVINIEGEMRVVFHDSKHTSEEEISLWGVVVGLVRKF